MQLAGIVDESFDPETLVHQAIGNKVVLNLKGIARLTSFGVREWSAAMRQLSGRVERLYWVECSPAVVSQLNMVANFAGNAQVLSVQAPFYCEACGTDCEVRCDIQEGSDPLPQEVRCPKCGKSMEFDEDPDSYFGFPKENKAQERPLDLAMLSILRSLGVAVGSADDIDARPENGEATQRSAAISAVASDVIGPPTRTATLDRVRSISSASDARSETPRSFTTTMIEVMDRHWAIVVGLAVIVVFVALYLLLTTPPTVD